MRRKRVIRELGFVFRPACPISGVTDTLCKIEWREVQILARKYQENIVYIFLHFVAK